MKLNGSHILVECLKKEKVDVIFGYPGGTIMPFYDALYDEKEIRHILTRHEQGAAHAADGYARSTGRVGVCVATSGPGATNLVTGLATANMDSVPIVALTGQVPTKLIGTDAFQEADITGITAPITKHNYLVKDVSKLAQTIAEAFYIATTGRPGVVVVDLPKDVLIAEADFHYPKKIALMGYKQISSGNISQVKMAAKEISLAERPVIIAGGGIIIGDAYAELADFAKKCNIPVVSTLMGKGSFDETSDLSLGMLGMHGTAYANFAICEADLIIALGTKFSDRVTGKTSEFGSSAKLIHIDIDPAEIGKNVKADIPIVGDVKETLKELTNLVPEKDHSSWFERINVWREKHPLRSFNQDVLNPQFIINKIYEETGGDAIIVTEVGQNQMWAAQYFKYKAPRTFISSGGLGTMGYGFPASIGAKVANPDKPVFDIAGDGSIQMNIQELATAVYNDIDVNIIILNNEYLGMVRQWQEIFYEKRYSSTSLKGNPDFVKLAEAYGAKGKHVTEKDDFVSALKDALNSGSTYLIDCVIPCEENVYPMVAPGSCISKMMGVEE
ncbi:MAG TPA: biosynthetic-type acetolactate synthase large subunit [Candidatus Methanofastidiosa archaeon]|nr:biosynthetic-type acetolactate synthase large subunit [Candidatus Methanofastidiosa archaeon]